MALKMMQLRIYKQKLDEKYFEISSEDMPADYLVENVDNGSFYYAK